MKRTPTRAALVKGSPLVPAVKSGLGALQKEHKTLIHPEVQPAFADSLDLDAAPQAQHPNDHRWDYLLGHQPSGSIIGLEPHSARQREISAVINKRKAALQQLKDHLKPEAQIAAWLWVASGKTEFADTEKAKRLLDQNGITFVGQRVLAKHLRSLE